MHSRKKTEVIVREEKRKRIQIYLKDAKKSKKI